MATVIDGSALAAGLREKAELEVAALARDGIRPGLATVLAGDDYAAGTGAILERQAGGWEIAARVASEIAPLEGVVGGEIGCEGGTAGRFPCGNVDLLAFLPVQSIGGARGVELNDIWGWTDPETGREYALVGRVDGTSFVDVTDPPKIDR